MSPLVAYHATRPACRASISAHGLLPNKPTGERPYGVYVFRDDDSFAHVGRNTRTEWECGRRQDLWQVAYIGPLMPDRYVLNAMILLGIADRVTLVTGNHCG